MRRSILLVSSPYSVRGYEGGSRAVLWEIELEALDELILELSLVYFELSDRLTVRFSARAELVLSCEFDDAGQMKIDEEIAAVSLPRPQLEYMLAYLLRFRRDGYAAVQHLDVAINDASTLVLQARNFTAPMDESEARRVLERDE